VRYRPKQSKLLSPAQGDFMRYSVSLWRLFSRWFPSKDSYRVSRRIHVARGPKP